MKTKNGSARVIVALFALLLCGCSTHKAYNEGYHDGFREAAEAYEAAAEARGENGVWP